MPVTPDFRKHPMNRTRHCRGRLIVDPARAPRRGDLYCGRILSAPTKRVQKWRGLHDFHFIGHTTREVKIHERGRKKEAQLGAFRPQAPGDSVRADPKAAIKKSSLLSGSIFLSEIGDGMGLNVLVQNVRRQCHQAGAGTALIKVIGAGRGIGVTGGIL